MNLTTMNFAVGNSSSSWGVFSAKTILTNTKIVPSVPVRLYWLLMNHSGVERLWIFDPDFGTEKLHLRSKI
jgi:hypothetical protein